jgi:aminopeptidase N
MKKIFNKTPLFDISILIIIVITLVLQSCHAPKKVSKFNKNDLSPLVINKNNANTIYRASFPLLFSIPKTYLKVGFDFEEKTLIGNATLTIKPNKLITLDSIILDAKNMEISKVSIGNEILAFRQEKQLLIITLNKPLDNEQSADISINYVANPGVNKQKGSSSIRDAKGLYFINPLGIDSFKPTQIWTQGETESNSCWFPTIDKPNAKSTFTIEITVPNKFTTLSNGTLIKTINNGSTKTDIWQQNLPMSNYLVMMAIGEYYKENDFLNKLPVDYYVEPQYKSTAKAIFNNTPQMIDFFGKKLGVPFPWDKYAQVTARDYVSGAMENTSASLFGEFVQKDEHEIVDDNNDGIVAHELFHQWFGDLITCESWSNLFVNEGFASYGEYLWNEYKYGKDEADRGAYYDLVRYYSYAKTNDHPIVRFYYNDKEDMFNTITYRKGARVLHLLRHELGDNIFFEGLKHFLTTHAYKAAEVHDLRISMEYVSGKDLNPFFNQWLYKGGYPTTTIDYLQIGNQLQITINQNNDSGYIFTQPITFKVLGKQSMEYKTIVKKASQTFTLDISNLISTTDTSILIYPNATHTYIGKIIENTSLANKINCFKKANNFYDKISLIEAIKNQDTSAINLIAQLAMQDDNKYIQKEGMQLYKKSILKTDTSVINYLEKQAVQNSFAPNRAIAFDKLAQAYTTNNFLNYKKDAWLSLATNALKTDTAYLVRASAFNTIQAIDTTLAYTIAKQNITQTKGDVTYAMANCIAKYGNSADTAILNYIIPRSFGGDRQAFLNFYLIFAQKQANLKVWQAATKSILHYIKYDDRNSIKISAVKNINLNLEMLAKENNKINKDKALTDTFITNTKAALNEIYKNETNPLVIEEYKKLKLIP